jgi:SAM-dependent methyltransferase
MDIWLYYDVTHGMHQYCNPVNETTIRELEDILELTPETRVLDIASGLGEMLVGFAERHGSSGVGVDVSPYAIRRAGWRREERVPDADLRFLEMRGEDYVRPEGEVFDVVMCIGASWIWSGYEGTIAALRGLVKPGGLIVSGEPYWRCAPSPEYLKADGMSEQDYFDLQACEEIAGKQGLDLVWMRASSLQDWDRYEMTQVAAVDRFARENPDHPDLDDIRDGVRRGKEAYLRWGRREMGFAFWVFRTPQ